MKTPSAEQILTDLKENNPENDHPRIMGTPAIFARVEENIKNNKKIQEWYSSLKQRGEQILEQPPSKYEIPDGKRLLRTSRRVRARIEDLGLLFKLAGERKYAERAWRELKKAAGFPDWNPSHFLDTAEMTAAFAIGYDWFFDYWSKEQKETIRTAIVELGLTPGIEAYRGTSNQFFTRAIHNWNVVCNGGLAMGALAIGDEREEIAGEILEAGLKSLQNMMPEFEPDGAWAEGVGYWHYTVRFLVNYMESLDTALGTTYGNLEYPGVKETSYFPVAMSGTNGTFNFHDCGSGNVNAPELFWFADRMNKPDLAGIRLKLMEDFDLPPAMRDILWYEPESCSHDFELKCDHYFREVETASFRSDWADPDAIFLGFHAGSNSVNHGNLDIGTFVLDALGERWATDLGSDNYNLPGYFGSRRWEYYRMRAEGHNTLIINPGQGPDQKPDSFSRITDFHSGKSGGYAIADISPSFSQHVTEARRGVKIFDERSRVLIQDELKTTIPSRIWWFMHTEADIELRDGGNMALLKKGGKMLAVRIAAPDQAAFAVLAAGPLASSPDPEGQAVNTGVKKLAIQFEDISSLTLSVVLIPLEENGAIPSELTRPVPIKDWNPGKV